MLAPSFSHSLSLLLQATRYAEELDCNAWDFAVEISSLIRLGLSNSDIRWLLVKGLIRQGIEIIPPPPEQKRAFSALMSLVLDERSCFILTTEGVALARTLTGTLPVRCGLDSSPEPEATNGPVVEVDAHTPPFGGSSPWWDKDRRILRFRDRLVKQFKVPAPNQELILTVFEEEKWTPRIDDPLPRTNLIEPKRRLHDTINSLNRNQRSPLLRFLGDGNGLGLCWEPLKALPEQGNGEKPSPQLNASE